MERVFRPGMLRVAAAEVFPHLMIGGRPEAPQVVGDLDGPIVGSQQVQQDGNPPARQPRRFGPAEQLLESDSQDRRPP